MFVRIGSTRWISLPSSCSIGTSPCSEMSSWTSSSFSSALRRAASDACCARFARLRSSSQSDGKLWIFTSSSATRSSRPSCGLLSSTGSRRRYVTSATAAPPRIRSDTTMALDAAMIVQIINSRYARIVAQTTLLICPFTPPMKSEFLRVAVPKNSGVMNQNLSAARSTCPIIEKKSVAIAGSVLAMSSSGPSLIGTCATPASWRRGGTTSGQRCVRRGRQQRAIRVEPRQPSPPKTPPLTLSSWRWNGEEARVLLHDA